MVPAHCSRPLLNSRPGKSTVEREGESEKISLFLVHIQKVIYGNKTTVYDS